MSASPLANGNKNDVEIYAVEYEDLDLPSYQSDFLNSTSDQDWTLVADFSENLLRLVCGRDKIFEDSHDCTVQKVRIYDQTMDLVTVRAQVYTAEGETELNVCLHIDRSGSIASVVVHYTSGGLTLGISNPVTNATTRMPNNIALCFEQVLVKTSSLLEIE